MGAVGEGSSTVNKAYVTAGTTLTGSGSDYLEFTVTVGASGISTDGQVRFNLPAGGFIETGHGDCFDIWDAATSSVEVRDHLGNLLSTPTNYTVAYGGNGVWVRIDMVTAVQSGATVKMRFWGQVSRVATQYQPDGVLRPVIKSCQTSGSGCFGATDQFERPNCCLPVANVAGFEVRNASLAKFLVVIPMVLAWEGSRSEEFDLAVVALDGYANPCGNPAYTGTITLESAESWQVDDDTPSTSRQVTFTSGEAGVKVLQRVRFTTRPAHDFAWIEADVSGVGSISNPASLEDNPNLRIAVADLHVHMTNDHMSGNFTTPEQAARYARDCARLDGTNLVEHAEIFNDDERYTAQEQYQRQLDAALAYTGDRFWVEQGAEWTKNDDVNSVEGVINHHHFCGFPIQSGNYALGFGSDLLVTEEDLVEKLRSIGHNLILISHPMHGQKRWDLEDPPYNNPVEIGEIVSHKVGLHHDLGITNGSYSPTAWPRGFEVPGYNPNWQEGLEPGDQANRAYRYRHTLRYAWSQREGNRKKLAIVGSSDCHIGNPGHPSWGGWGQIDPGGNLGYQRLGLAMIWAGAKDSCSCFRALQAKRCYATSGVRVFMDFQVRNAAGTYAMQGQTLSLAAGTYDFEVSLRVACPRNIKLLEVYRYDPFQPTGGTFGDGYITVKSYANVGARSLDVTLTGENPPGEGKTWEGHLEDIPVGNSPYDYFLFYLFVQQDEGAYAGNAAWSSPVWVEKL